MKAGAKSPRTSKERERILRDLRSLKMARSVHAFVRGNTHQFYDWLETSHSSRIPDGPDVWICGDCHLGNLGPVAGADNTVDIQIRDLDQTVVGNPSHDIIRLGLSLAMVARGSELSGVTTARMLEAVMAGYRGAMTNRAFIGPRPDLIAETFKDSLRRKWRHLARERLENPKPTIPMGKRFWPLFESERHGVEALVQHENLRLLLTKLKHRDNDSVIELVDAAYWVKGCSSLGTLRIAALIALSDEKKTAATNELCLVDIKQAGATAAPRAANASMPRGHAERVVSGARHLSPYLGERMIASEILESPVIVRELLPRDLKITIGRLNRSEVLEVAGYLAHVVGRAHWRQMDAPTKRSWKTDLNRTYTKTLDAPSWLWASVVDLVAKHEAAYLEHCRKFALRQK